MSEKLNLSNESEAQHTPEHHYKSAETVHKKPESAHHNVEKTKDEIDRTIESLKNIAEKQAISSSELKTKESTQEEKPHHIRLTKNIKQSAYKKTLKNVQKQLPPTQRTFSKIIHKPVIDNISNVASKTVARPTGILSGGVGALAGSITLYYLSKQYGFVYNFLVYFLLFIAFYCAGILIELLIKFIISLRKKSEV
jgi:hypothetical protein